ncbi:MAG: helix-turn-helix domain-containing protein [Lachnospiraceae bacterium]|nr:helix-turn-helix domain-containing protein [Lachnospiraceae bacterium]
MGNLFTTFNPSVASTRIIYTPSVFARSSLIHLQETGVLKAMYPHKSERSGLHSCLFFTVLSGSGRLTYDGMIYSLQRGDCVFIDCRKKYWHETGGDTAALWSLQWCHFYGPNMNAIYQKYQERGGKPVFHPERISEYCNILTEIYQIAESDDYVRDMRIHEKLSSLLILLMEDAWDTDKGEKVMPDTLDVQGVKEYLDMNFKEKITLDDLASRFYISKYYLLELFKERYGITVNAYLNQQRITYIKQQLRFTDETVECIAEHLHIEPTYLSRLFKKMEGVSPGKFRKVWKGTVPLKPNGEKKDSVNQDNLNKAVRY